MERHIILDGLPAEISRNSDKFAKFRGYFLNKIANALGLKDSDTFNVEFFYNEDNKVDGCFIQFDRKENADRALEILGGFALVKGAVLKAYRWSELDRTANISEMFKPLQITDEEENMTGLTNNMMLDPDARPQFMLKMDVGEYDTIIQWNWLNWKPGKKVVEVYRAASKARTDRIGSWTAFDRELSRINRGSHNNALCRNLPVWSPYGTYLATAHEDGIRVWGGRGMVEILHVGEIEITDVIFSPNENYLVVESASGVGLWSTRQGKRLRTLGMRSVESNAFSTVKFNSDDTFCSTIHCGTFIIYDTATGNIVRGIDNNFNYTIEDPCLIDGEWSPAQPNQIAFVYYENEITGYKVEICNTDIYYEQEGLNKVAKSVEFLTLLRRNFLSAEPPFDPKSKKWTDLDKGDLTKVIEEYKEYKLAILWHPRGSYLTAKVTIKTKRTVEFALFRVGLSTASAEQVIIQGTPVRFNWQAAGDYFAVIVKKKPEGKAAIVDRSPKLLQIYWLKAPKGIKMICSTPTQGNRILWSPNSPRVACIDFAISSVEVFGIDKNQHVVNYGKRDHPNVNNAEWDPSGRFLVTWTGYEAQANLGRAMGNQFIIGDMNNKIIFTQKFDSDEGEILYKLFFRPLAPSAIGAQELAKINDDLPAYIKRCHEDEAKKKLDEESITRERREKEEAEYINIMDAIYQQQNAKGYAKIRKALWDSAPACVARVRAGIFIE